MTEAWLVIQIKDIFEKHFPCSGLMNNKQKRQHEIELMQMSFENSHAWKAPYLMKEVNAGIFRSLEYINPKSQFNTIIYLDLFTTFSS